MTERSTNILRSLPHLARFFYVQRVRGFDVPQEPFFDPETLSWFRSALRRANCYLEYGSGGSTLLADAWGIRTVSIEGDRYYARTVRSALSARSTVEIVTPPMGITVDWAWPLFGAPVKGERYVRAPFTRLGSSFPDLVLVDGRYRVACALAAAQRAEQLSADASLLLDDYRDRPAYQVVARYLGPPEPIGRAALFRIGRTAIPDEAIEFYQRDPG